MPNRARKEFAKWLRQFKFTIAADGNILFVGLLNKGRVTRMLPYFRSKEDAIRFNSFFEFNGLPAPLESFGEGYVLTLYYFAVKQNLCDAIITIDGSEADGSPKFIVHAITRKRGRS